MDVGVVLPVEEIFPGSGPPPSYATVKARARRVEELGFHSVWMGDHLLFRKMDNMPFIEGTNGAWESWTFLTGLAEATSRINLGSWVLCTPLRNPAVLAKMAITLDEVSGGRFILGLGSGWNKPVFDAFGIPFTHKVDRFDEALQIIVPLLREGHVDFQGKYYQAPNCDIAPRGPSAHGPRILIASLRPRMLRLTAKYADIWNRSTGYPTIPTSQEELYAGLDEACRDVGRDITEIDMTVRLMVAFPEAGPLPDWLPAGRRPTGKEEVVTTLRAYKDLGVKLAFCQFPLWSDRNLEVLAEAVQESGVSGA